MLKRFSPEQAAEIVAQARATLARPFIPASKSERQEDSTSASDPPGDHAPRPETINQRHAREIAEQEQKFARERARREHRLDTPLITVTDVDARIAAALAAERQVTIPALRAAVDELLECEREHVKSQMTEQMRRLELQIVRLESALNALQTVLAVERTKAIDLPNPLRSVN